MFSRFVAPRRDFSSLSEKETLALAISAEEEDGRIYAAYADRLRENFPASAAIFEGMAEEEDTHRRRLIDRYSERFGPTIVPLRREHVRGFFTRKPVWLMAELDLDTVRGQAREMEQDAARFYAEAAKRTSDAETRNLLRDLERAERGHEHTAAALEDAHFGADARVAEK